MAFYEYDQDGSSIIALYGDEINTSILAFIKVMVNPDNQHDTEFKLYLALVKYLWNAGIMPVQSQYSAYLIIGDGKGGAKIIQEFSLINK